MKLHGVDTSLPTGTEIVDDVVAHTISILERTKQMPTIDTVANAMGYSTRTLQRHLDNSGNISFEDITLQVKRNLIAKHIISDMTIDEISDCCGFTTRSSIMRFVRRNWQCTCSQLRKEAKKLSVNNRS